MYRDINEDGENRKRSSGAPKFAALIVLTASFAALSSFLGMMLPAFAAAASVSYIVRRHGSALGAFAAAASSFGVVFLITRDVLSASQTAAVIVLAGAAMFVLGKRRAGVFPSSLVLGGIMAAVIAAFFLIAIYKEYGDIIGGTAKYFSDLYAAFKARILELGSSTDQTALISESAIDAAASVLSSVIPGIAAFLIQALGVEAYIVYRVFYRVADRGVREAKRTSRRIPRSIPIFLALSFFISMIFSISEKTELIYLAAVNMVMALSLPTFIDGASRLVERIRRPAVIETPAGPVRRRPPVLLIVFLVISALMSPLIPAVMVMIYSVVGTIADIVKERRKNEDV